MTMDKSGVSFTGLQELLAQAHGASDISELVKRVIRTALPNQDAAYISLIPEEKRGQPSHIIIAAWTLNLKDFEDLLRNEAGTRPNGEVFFWVDFIACSLTSGGTVADRLEGGSQQQSGVDAGDTAEGEVGNSGLTRADTASALTPSAASLDAYRSVLAADSVTLLLLLDPDCAVLTNAWCVYGIWAFQRQCQLRPASDSLQPGTIIPLCAAGVDAMLLQLVWEQLSLANPSPHTPDATHTSILQEVTAASSSPSAATGSSAGAATGPLEPEEPDVEACIAATDAAVKKAVADALSARVQQLETAAAAVESAPAVDKSTQDQLVKAAEDTLAATCDAAGCITWADGRPGDAEPLLRRARDTRVQAQGPHPLTSALSSMHLGAVHQALYGRTDEGELLLRSAIELLDALPGAAAAPAAAEGAAEGAEGAAATADGGAGGNSGGTDAAVGALAAPLLAAQARHYLAMLLSARATGALGQRQGATLARNTTSKASNPPPNKAVSHAGEAADSAAAAAGGGGRAAPNRAVSVAGTVAAAEQLQATVPLPLVGGGGGGGRGSSVSLTSVCSGAASLQLPPGGTPREVVPLLRAVVPAFEAHYGAGHPLTATAMSNLALALKDHGRLSEAEPLLRRALAAREATHGPAHIDTLRAMNNLAGLVEAQGNLEEAEALLRRTAEAAASSLGPLHAYTANALSNLGVALRKAGKMGEAEELFTAALEIREKVLGPAHLDTAASLGDMTLLLLEQGRLAEAEPLFRRILDIRELVLGPAHKDTAASLCDLATLLAQLDRSRDAEPLLRRAVSIHVRSLGPGHEDTAGSTRELAKVLAQQGNTSEAEKQYRRALAVMEAVLGPSHPETTITLNQLGLLLKDQGRGTEAEALLRRVLAATESYAATRSPKTATTEAAAATTNTTTTTAPTAPTAEGGAPTPADPAATTAAAPATPAPAAPASDPRPEAPRQRAACLVALRGLAELAAAEGRAEEAEVFLCRALVLSERSLGATHDVTLGCAEGLAVLLAEQGMLDDASELTARMLEGIVEEQGEDSEAAVRYLSLYEQIYKLMVARDAAQAEQDLLQQQQQQQQHQQRGAADGEGADDECEGDADGGAPGTGAPSPSGSSPGPRFSALVAPSGVSNASSALVALMGPFRGGGGGGGEDSKRARRLQGGGGGGGGGDASEGEGSAGGAGGQGVHHSFASFVSRRSQAGKSEAVTSATIGSAVGGGVGGGAGGGAGGELAPTGRTQSVTSSVHAVVERVHSTLVASGRIESVSALAGGTHRLSRFAGGGGGGGAGGAGSGGGASRRTIAAGSVGNTSRRTASASPIIPGGLNGLVVGGTADPDGATVGPGLPVIDANGLGGSGVQGEGDGDTQAVPGSARLRASAPGQGQGKRGSGSGDGGKRGKRGSSGAGEGEAERERTSKGPTVEELRKLQGSASRRTGAGQSQQTMRGQLSTKAMLQQADIDLDDEAGSTAGIPAVGVKHANGPNGHNGRHSGDGAGGVYGSDEEDDMAAVGCCGLGGRGKHRPARVSPAPPSKVKPAE